MSHATRLAQRYDDAISAYWRGDPAPLRLLERWFAGCWQADDYRPTSPVVAVNPHAAGGRGLHWYEDRAGLVGLVPGTHGCVRVSPGLMPPEPVDIGRTADPDVLVAPADAAVAERPARPHALGDLAVMVLDQHGAAARDAVVGLVGRTRHLPDAASTGRAYDVLDLARQPLRPGGWVTVGEVASSTGVRLVELNVTNGATRELGIGAG